MKKDPIWYTPWAQDRDDLALRKARRSPWWSLMIPFMLVAAFLTTPIMGFAMLGTIVLLSFKK